METFVLIFRLYSEDPFPGAGVEIFPGLESVEEGLGSRIKSEHP